MIQASNFTVTVVFTPEEKNKLKIDSKINDFTEEELEKLLKTIASSLQTVQVTEFNNWRASNKIQKAWYYVDFLSLGENAKTHSERTFNAALLNKIKSALQILQTGK